VAHGSCRRFAAAAERMTAVTNLLIF
jgi:hypothetical protein